MKKEALMPRSLTARIAIAAATGATGVALLAGCAAIAPEPIAGSAPASASPQPSSVEQAPSQSSEAAEQAPCNPALPGCTDPNLPEIAEQAAETLNGLPVKGPAPMTGYDRVGKFGQRWSDDVDVTYGHNGCDTRNDILRRDLLDLKYKGTSRCLIASGILNDPYTGKRIDFVRGQGTSEAVQIEHVVALGNAWRTGAQQLTAEERKELANDPRNLLAVDGQANQQKSDGDAATWLPPNKSYRCHYVAKQIKVKSIYRLWVTPAEKAAMSRVLEPCLPKQSA